jgi:hypothetical protein
LFLLSIKKLFSFLLSSSSFMPNSSSEGERERRVERERPAFNSMS